MPTGYTSDIHDGKNATLPAYLRRCVKAFILDTREDPIDAPIPERSTYKDEVVSHYEQKVKASLDSIYELEGMTDAQAEQHSQAEYQSRLTQIVGWNDERKALERRYLALLSEVTAWEAPTPLAGVRSFMIEQLQQSIKWDCDPFDLPAAPLSGAEWLADQIATSQRMHAQWTAELEKQREGQKHNNTFMETLHAELRRLESNVSAQEQSK